MFAEHDGAITQEHSGKDFQYGSIVLVPGRNTENIHHME